MKRTLLISITLVLVFSINTLNAQIINPGFETWTNDIIVPTAQNPNSGNNTFGWWDYNYFNNTSFGLGGSPVSVFQCGDTVHSGTYSVRIETKKYTPTSWNIYKLWGYPFIGHEYNDTLGILFNGKVNVYGPSFIPGLPFTEYIDQVKFYYQYLPNGNDTAEFRVALRSNGNYIAGGVFKTGQSTAGMGWQLATIDMVYINGGTPDTLYILTSSSSLDYAPSEGSVFYLDDISYTVLSGVEHSLYAEEVISIYPNPATGRIRIDVADVENIEIMDIDGKQVYNGIETDIDLSNEAKGIYIVKATTKNGVAVKKFILE